MTAQTDDPQMIIAPDVPMQSGWYRIRAVIDAVDDIHPQVFFDFGSGFSEMFSIRLHRIAASDVYTFTVKLPFPALCVRLDPMSAAGEFRLRCFKAERLRLPAVARALTVFGWAVMLANPRNFVERLPTYLSLLSRPSFLRLANPEALARTNSITSYRQWIARNDFDGPRDGDRIRKSIQTLEERPLISVVMPVYNTPENLLRAAIDSVRNQIYVDWQLCIADDRSTAGHVRSVLTEYAAADKRIKIVFREHNGHISHATNSAFALADGEWIALLDHDDILRPHALAEVALEIGRHPDTELIYSDEDKLDANGNRYDPYFKPDFSRELFRAQNYFNHLTVHRAENIRAVGGWRAGFEGSQDYDLNLRVLERIDPKNIRHIPKVLYHWRAVEGSTASSAGEKTYAYTAGLRALEEHVARTGVPAKVEPAPDTSFYRLRFAVPEPAPLVSLIVPTRDKVELLRGCVESILRKTTYSPYEIVIVDNGSVEPATHAYFEQLRAHANVRILDYDKPFNYSAINNYAVSKAKGSIVGLINNDIEVISPDWLGEMVSWAAQADVGCVGAKLYYANDTIQHAGVILGIGGVAGHSHKYFPRDDPGYFSRLKVVQNLSAVTGACLVVRKEIFIEVCGLNANDLTIAFNDVDFCLKVRQAGYVNVWTPFAELYHLESVSRGAEDDPEKRKRFAREAYYMQKTWDLRSDPYYSRNLTPDREDFSIGA